MESGLRKVSNVSENDRCEDPKPTMWTPVLVERFWTVMSRRPDAEDSYFTSIYGQSIAEWSQRNAHLQPGMRVCDWGSGWGHLALALAQMGLYVTCIDQVATLGAAAANHPAVGFVPLREVAEIEERSFDGAFLIETIEHLDDNAVELTLSALHRIVKPGGFLIVTTPNQENLSKNEVYCANCDSIFHPWQHVRSVSRGWLSEVAVRNGWMERYTQELEFEPPGAARFLARARTLRARWSREKGGKVLPHLAWFGVSAGEFDSR